MVYSVRCGGRRRRLHPIAVNSGFLVVKRAVLASIERPQGFAGDLAAERSLETATRWGRCHHGGGIGSLLKGIHMKEVSLKTLHLAGP